MLQKRIIVCLDVDAGRTTKGINFKNNIDIGDPVEMAARYYAEGADEVVFYDISASHQQRDIMVDIVRRVAARMFIPLSVGGGIRTVHDMRGLLLAGAEKVSVNSAAVANPSLIDRGARMFGNQCIVLGMDAAADITMPSGYRVFVNGGRIATNLDALAWAQRAVDLGVGEIVVNSIDADGTGDGYELNLTAIISRAVPVPVVASGGAGTPGHLCEVLTTGAADAALVASMVHYRHYSIEDIKRYLQRHQIAVRLDW